MQCPSPKAVLGTRPGHVGNTGTNGATSPSLRNARSSEDTEGQANTHGLMCPIRHEGTGTWEHGNDSGDKGKAGINTQ